MDFNVIDCVGIKRFHQESGDPLVEPHTAHSSVSGNSVFNMTEFLRQTFAESRCSSMFVVKGCDSFAETRSGKNWVALKSGKERMMMSFASLEKGVMQESRGMPSGPADQTSIYRWMSTEQFQDNVLVTALNPGSKRLGVTVRREADNGYAIGVTGPDGYARTIRVTEELRPVPGY